MCWRRSDRSAIIQPWIIASTKERKGTYRSRKALAVNDVARKRRLMQDHRVAGAIANHIEDATADQLCRGDGGAIRQLHSR